MPENAIPLWLQRLMQEQQAQEPHGTPTTLARFMWQRDATRFTCPGLVITCQRQPMVQASTFEVVTLSPKWGQVLPARRFSFGDLLKAYSPNTAGYAD